MKRNLVITAFAFGSLAMLAFWLAWRGVLFSGVPAKPPAHTQEERLAPELSLSANGSFRTMITPGMPLVLRLTLRNSVAAERLSAMRFRQRMEKELDEMVRGQEMTREKADEMLKREAIPSSVPGIVVTLAAEGFSFERSVPQGTTTLPWKPRMVDPIATAIVALDEKQIASATFVVTPEETAGAREEAYTMRAQFENRASGQWQGKIASNPVVVSVVEAPRALTVREQKERQQNLVGYYLAMRRYDEAITTARKILSLDPQSIDGLALIGSAQEEKGDLRAALDAYEGALTRFYERHPKADHLPEALMLSIQRVRDKLGIELQVIEEPLSPEGR